MIKIAIATTILSKHGSPLRETLAIKTAKEVARHNYPIVAVYSGPRSLFVEKLEGYGVRVMADAKQGMGASRRQALKEASRIVGKSGVVVWMEPEKYPFVRYIAKLAKLIFNKEADLVIPMRSNLRSYPKEQRESETLMNRAFERVLRKEKADLSFGPRIMNRRALSYFINYKGEYGDKWDSIIIPILKIIKVGLSVRYIDVPYTHPSQQTDEEEGDMHMFMKRIEQFCNVAPSFYAAAKKLDII